MKPSPAKGFGARVSQVSVWLGTYLLVRAIGILIVYQDRRALADAVLSCLVPLALVIYLGIKGYRQFEADLCEAYPLASPRGCRCSFCVDKK